MIKKFLYSILGLSLLASCAIENDIPYPIREAAIESFEVEGQCAAPGSSQSSAATINATDRTVSLYVDDAVDISNLRILKMTVTNDAQIVADSAVCTDFSKFPTEGFEVPDNFADTRVDFSNPVTFTLRTYQDYAWKVSVTQVINRQIDVTGQIRYVLDEAKRTVIIYVSSTQDRGNIQVNALSLGGSAGVVSPDPTTVHDFSSPRTFLVANGWEKDVFREWTVYVYPEEGGSSSSSSEVFAMTSRAVLNGNIESGKTPVVEYKEASATSWQTVSDVTVSGTTYTAMIKGLKSSTAYNYRVSIDGTQGSEKSFTTAAAVTLENGGLENWSKGQIASGDYWIPNAEGSTFWGTGNSATAIYKTNITNPTSDKYAGTYAAELKSQSALNVKMAAGNLFAGDFQQDPNSILDGLLHFGRPFTSFPTSLRVYCKYTSEPMQTVGSTTKLPSSLEALKGRPDSCHIYIALSDKSEPYEIRTDPTNRQLFDKNDANIIAYGEYICGEDVPTYQQIDIPLTYRAYRTPKYLVIVCSSSKYGDYYLAGEGSTLWLDEMELVYE